MQRGDDRIPSSPEVFDAVDHRVFGMPGPVWTMVLWFGAATVILTLALIFPMTPTASLGLRLIVLVYAVIVLVALLVMRERTPLWFLYVQTAMSIAASLWIVFISASEVGAVTSSVSFVAVAAYMGWWMPRMAAVLYMTLASIALLLVFDATDRLPELVIPWLVVCGISMGLMLAFGALVAHMKQQMVTDPLTGLLNRQGMVALVDHRSEVARTITPRTLMVIDLDKFKEINDRKGHLAGDRALAEFGRALHKVIRPDDIAFRSGGDEFVVILPRTDIAGATSLAERLRREVAVEWSYGLTEWELGEDFDAAVGRADKVMYAQKQARASTRGAS